ncbi:MAG: hypothetical protein JNL58_17275 [Planctomyces sp.]|nr:hypothetical protein [Planctomyces sp.]
MRNKIWTKFCTALIISVLPQCMDGLCLAPAATTPGLSSASAMMQAPAEPPVDDSEEMRVLQEAGLEPFNEVPVSGVDIDIKPPSTPNERVSYSIVRGFSVRGNLSAYQELSDRCLKNAGLEIETQSSGEFFDLLQEIGNSIKELEIDQETRATIGMDLLFLIPRNGEAELRSASLMVFSAAGDTVKKVLGKEDDPTLQKLLNSEDGFLFEDGAVFLFRNETIVVLQYHSDVIVEEAEVRSVMETAFRNMKSPETGVIAEIIFEPGQTDHQLKQPFLQTILASLDADLQRRDDEPELEFRFRDSYGTAVRSFVDVVANQLKSLRFVIRNSEFTGNLCWDLEIEAIPDSDLDLWIERQSKVRNQSVRSLHPDNIGFATVSLAIPETLQTSLPFVGAALAGYLKSEDLMSEAGEQELSSAIRTIAESESFELLLQIVPDEEHRPNFLLSMPLNESSSLSNAAIELVSRTEEENVETHFADIEGWPVQRLGKMDESDVFASARVAPTDILFFSNEQQAVLHLATPESMPVLEQVVLQKFPDQQHADGYRQSGFSLAVRVSHFLKTAYPEDANEGMKEIYGTRADSDDLQDMITITMHEDVHKLQIRTEFQKDIEILGVVGFFQVFSVSAELAD